MSCCAPEVEVELRGWWPVSGVLWRRLWIGGEVEGGHQRDFEAGDEGFGASLVHGSGGLAEQAEQQIGDQGGVNLGFDGVFGSPEEAFDLITCSLAKTAECNPAFSEAILRLSPFCQRFAAPRKQKF